MINKDRRQIALILLRVVLALLMFIHGTARIRYGTVGGFGEFLTEKGFPLGFYLAWGLTIFELVGSVVLATGYFASIIAVIFAVHLTFGIILVHAKVGWFVVGAGTGGSEYSVLLIAAFIAIAISHFRQKK